MTFFEYFNLIRHTYTPANPSLSYSVGTKTMETASSPSSPTESIGSSPIFAANAFPYPHAVRRTARSTPLPLWSVKRHRALPDVRTTGRRSQRTGCSDAASLCVPVGRNARGSAPRDGIGGRMEDGAGGMGDDLRGVVRGQEKWSRQRRRRRRVSPRPPSLRAARRRRGAPKDVPASLSGGLPARSAGGCRVFR